MNRRGFFGALASVCGAAAGAAVAIALPAPRALGRIPIRWVPFLEGDTRPVYGINWGNYAAPHKQLSDAEVAAMMEKVFWQTPMPGSPFGLHYWLTKR